MNEQALQAGSMDNNTSIIYVLALLHTGRHTANLLIEFINNQYVQAHPSSGKEAIRIQ